MAGQCTNHAQHEIGRRHGTARAEDIAIHPTERLVFEHGNGSPLGITIADNPD